MNKIIIWLCLCGMLIAAPKLKEKKPTKESDLLAWAINQDKKDKPWRDVYELERNKDIDFAKENAEYVQRLLEKRFQRQDFYVMAFVKECWPELTIGTLSRSIYCIFNLIDGDITKVDWSNW